MNNPKDAKQRIIHRMKICRGHLIKVIEMVDQEEYCLDISHQLTAVRIALHKIDELIIEEYVRSKFKNSINTSESKQLMNEITLLLKHNY